MFFFCLFFVVVFVFLLRTYRTAKITDLKDQMFCIKFCFQFDNTGSVTHEMFKEVLGDNYLDQKQTYEWLKRFKKRRMSVDDEERP